MSNMSYCRFNNTNLDLEECLDVLRNDELTGENEHGEFLSETEFQAALELIEKCRQITEMYENQELHEICEEYEINTKRR